MEEEEDFRIDSVQFENFIKKSGVKISKKFMGVFPADEKNRFNDISIEIKNKGAKYSFMIANTDSAGKDEWHLCSFLDINGEDSLFFWKSRSPRNSCRK